MAYESRCSLVFLKRSQHRLFRVCQYRVEPGQYRERQDDRAELLVPVWATKHVSDAPDEVRVGTAHCIYSPSAWGLHGSYWSLLRQHMGTRGAGEQPTGQPARVVFLWVCLAFVDT